MKTATQFFKFGKISGKNGLLGAMRHNKRTLQSDRGADSHIDVTRTTLNYALVGNDTPEEIATHAKIQMLKAGIDTPRKNAVLAVELLFSLPNAWHSRDTKPFFEDCLNWLKSNFACEILAFDVHLDEAAPHAHAVLLPLIDGKMQGSDLVGNRWNIIRLQKLFFNEVGLKYGLSYLQTRRVGLKDKQSIQNRVFDCLKNDAVLKSCIWVVVRDSIKNNPFPYAELLSINLPLSNSNKSFVDYKRARGKGSFVR